ncbi:MAG TPA: carboxymuconolactone decarboxylase family protein [Chloroflexota bacterium]
MPRIPAISGPDELAPEHRAVWEAIQGSRGQVRGPFAMLLHSPELAGRVAHLGAYVRFEGVVDPRTKEVVVLAGARELNCAFEWGAHSGELARGAGVTDDVIVAIRDRLTSALSPEDRQLVEYAQALVRDHTVDEPAVKAMEARFGRKGVVELTAQVGYYVLLATVLNAFAVEPLEGSPVLPA